MNHKNKRHRTISRIQKKFKNLAAAVAGAVVLTGSMLPGMPSATVHAAADPGNDHPSITSSQQVNNTKQSDTSKTSEKGNPGEHSDRQHSQDNNSKDTSKDTSSDKVPANYKDVLDIKATAYAPGAHDNDQWGDKTFLGTQIRPGIVAVDPDIIPLGSKLYIQYPDGHGEHAVAEDTGGAIKGNRIDVAKTSVDKAQDFGIKNVKVFVLEKGKS
jgi:3D (Asp-Asp-Asp) domain-containing protein